MKNLKNLGQALSKAEQKTINGGRKFPPDPNDCVSSGNDCHYLNGGNSVCPVGQGCFLSEDGLTATCQCL